MKFPGRQPQAIIATALVLLVVLNLPDTLPLQASDRDEAREGMHITEIDRGTSETVAWMRIRVRSDTPLDETWPVIEDIEGWDQVMELIQRVETLEIESLGGHYLLHFDPPWPIPDFKILVRAHCPPGTNSILWWAKSQGRMAGDFGKISGGKDDGGSWLLFEWFGPPSHRYPDWMVKIGIRFVMPSVLEDIYQHLPSRP